MSKDVLTMLWWSRSFCRPRIVHTGLVFTLVLYQLGNRDGCTEYWLRMQPFGDGPQRALNPGSNHTRQGDGLMTHLMMRGSHFHSFPATANLWIILKTSRLPTPYLHTNVEQWSKRLITPYHQQQK